MTSRLFLLTALTMVAFAANSVLNRMAIESGAIGPAGFSTVRVMSGAAALSLLVLLRGRGFPRPGFVGPASLTLYLLGFSFAYLTLDAGVGALILFGCVQITMFAGALIGGERPAAMRWLGAAIAFGGLAWLLWPQATVRPDALGAAFMAAAGLGWGVYSLDGRKAGDPLAATAVNFVAAAPVTLVALVGLPDTAAMTARGIGLGMVSGIVTSGLGYALWYSVLPRIAATGAAVAQLTVPVIAVAGGMAFLGEALTLRFVVSAALVLGGVALASRR